MKKVMVIGGGPAGITAAIYAKRGGMDTEVFSMGTGALGKAGRIDNYYGFPGGISGEELTKRGLEQARMLGIEIREEEVVGLEYNDGLSVVTTDGRYAADSLILAMGSPRKVPKVRGIEEFEGRGVSYCAVCDGFFFKGKDVAVLGTGQYAQHEADVLKPIAASVTMLESAAALEGGDTLERVILSDGTSKDISGLFVALGTAGSADLARKLGAAVKDNKIVTDEKMATNIPGLYAAGDCTGGLLQVAKAVHEGAVAGLSAVSGLK